VAWALAVMPGAAAPADRAALLQPCRLSGVQHEALCGQLRRPLDPAVPSGPHIDVHFAVLPAVARRKLPDPVFVFAGGPGQSAVDLAGPMSRLLATTLNRRDVVLVDQRGTGRSAPLHCDKPEPQGPLGPALDLQQQAERLRGCREALHALPHGDLRQFTTAVAVKDVEAVRQALGHGPVNLLAASYGTRAALEFMRQFPGATRRAVLDGVVPPDMSLPAAASADSQVALEAVFEQCDADRRCRERYPALSARWRAWLSTLPREVTLPHPVTGEVEAVRVTRGGALSLVRMALYSPAHASALPAVLAEAIGGRLAPLFALASAAAPVGARRGAPRLAEGMHHAVVCTEDMPRPDAPGLLAYAPGRDFGDLLFERYRRVCDGWPLGALPDGFRRVGPATVPMLLLSGGRDPATPPRHGARVAAALGPQARHVVAPHAGHGVLVLPCARDVFQRFLDAPAGAEALAVDTSCLQKAPAPRPFDPARIGAAG